MARHLHRNKAHIMAAHLKKKIHPCIICLSCSKLLKDMIYLYSRSYCQAWACSGHTKLISNKNLTFLSKINYIKNIISLLPLFLFHLERNDAESLIPDFLDKTGV